MHNNTPSVTAVSSEIFADVYGAAMQAVADYIARNPDKGCCGYACVVLDCPADDPRLEGIKLERDRKGRPYIPVPCGGYQSLDGKEYVAGAIVESLRFHGIESSINSWVD